jgi:hypothetical protein
MRREEDRREIGRRRKGENEIEEKKRTEEKG